MKNHRFSLYVIKWVLWKLHFYYFDNVKGSGVCNLFRLKSAVKVKIRSEFREIHATTFWFQSKTKRIIQLLHKTNYSLLACFSLLKTKSIWENSRRSTDPFRKFPILYNLIVAKCDQNKETPSLFPKPSQCLRPYNLRQ